MERLGDIYPYGVHYAMVEYPTGNGEIVVEDIVRTGVHTYKQTTLVNGDCVDVSDVLEYDIFSRELWSTSQLVDREERIDSTCPADTRNYIVVQDRDQRLYNKLWGRILKKAQYMDIEETILIPSDFRIDVVYPTIKETKDERHHDPLRYKRPELTGSNYIGPKIFVMMWFRRDSIFTDMTT